MRKVWVVNEPKGNRSGLGKYGELSQLVPGWVENRHLNKDIDGMMKVLDERYVDGDLIVFGGHAKLNMIVFHYVMTKFKIVRQLLSRGEGWFIATHDGREQPDGRSGEWWIPR